MATAKTPAGGRADLALGANLKRAVTEAHKLLDDLIRADMAELGLTLGEADVLTVVFVADYAVVPSEIADWLSLTRAGATGRLNTLERRGLIERTPHPSDRRSVTIALTTEGRALAEAVVDAKNATVLNNVVNRLGTTTAEALTSDLDNLTQIARSVVDT